MAPLREYLPMKSAIRKVENLLGLPVVHVLNNSNLKPLCFDKPLGIIGHLADFEMENITCFECVQVMFAKTWINGEDFNRKRDELVY